MSAEKEKDSGSYGVRVRLRSFVGVIGGGDILAQYRARGLCRRDCGPAGSFEGVIESVVLAVQKVCRDSCSVVLYMNVGTVVVL